MKQSIKPFQRRSLIGTTQLLGEAERAKTLLPEVKVREICSNIYLEGFIPNFDTNSYRNARTGHHCTVPKIQTMPLCFRTSNCNLGFKCSQLFNILPRSLRDLHKVNVSTINSLDSFKSFSIDPTVYCEPKIIFLLHIIFYSFMFQLWGCRHAEALPVVFDMFAFLMHSYIYSLYFLCSFRLYFIFIIVYILIFYISYFFLYF